MWNKTKEKLPDGNTQCLVIFKAQKDIEVLWWDDHYQSWNDYSNDDYCCEALDVEFWANMPELPKEKKGLKNV